jgi:hypothetical protein
MRRSRAQPPVELLDTDEDAAHLRDGVDPEVRPRAVSCTPVDLDLEVDEATVRDGELQLGRLGHDRGVRPDRGEHLLHAEARVLLVATAATTTSPPRPWAAASRQASSAEASPAFMS